MTEGEDEKPPGIELQPVVSESIPRHIPESQRAALAEAGLPEASPIPDKPLHVCPNCDYNLTGLTSRRCPECGEEFTLHEARMRAVDMSAPIKRMLRWERIERVKVYVGTALIVFSVWLQNVMPGSISGWIGFQLSPRGTVMLALMPMLFVIIWGYKTVWDRSWSDAIFLAGVATGAMAVFFASF